MSEFNRFVFVLGIALASAACDREDVPEASEPVTTNEAAAKAEKKPGSDDRYAARSPDEAATAGRTNEVTFVIEPRGDLKINTEYPWSIEFDPKSGVDFATTKLDKTAIELSEAAARLPVEITPTEAGEHTISARGNFSVCNPQRCDILRDEPLEFTVVAEAPADAPPRAADPPSADGAEPQ